MKSYFLSVSQGDCRSYSYVCGVTSKESPHWESLMFLARLIPRMCHNINRWTPALSDAQQLTCNITLGSFTSSHLLLPCASARVVYVFGSPVKEPPADITPTFLTTGVLSTLRQADFVAHSILRESGECVCVSVCVFSRLHWWGYITREVSSSAYFQPDGEFYVSLELNNTSVLAECELLRRDVPGFTLRSMSWKFSSFFPHLNIYYISHTITQVLLFYSSAFILPLPAN